jgi:hypothetical protein
VKQRLFFWFFFVISASGSISFSPVFKEQHECVSNAQAMEILLAGWLQEPGVKISQCLVSTTPEQGAEKQ